MQWDFSEPRSSWGEDALCTSVDVERTTLVASLGGPSPTPCLDCLTGVQVGLAARRR